MKEKGIAPIVVIVIVVVIILGIGVLYIYLRGDSATTVIQPNTDQAQSNLKSETSDITEIPVINEEGKVVQKTETKSPTVEAKPAAQNSSIDPDGGVTYTNESFHFSIKHPKDYVFEEKVRNYYNVESTEDPSELVYIYTLANPQISPTGGLAGDKIVVTVYNQGYEPLLQTDRNSKESVVKVAGIETTKNYAREGKLISVGPIAHKDKIYTIHYELPSALSDQTFFNAVLNSFKFTD